MQLTVHPGIYISHGFTYATPTINAIGNDGTPRGRETKNALPPLMLKKRINGTPRGRLTKNILREIAPQVLPMIRTRFTPRTADKYTWTVQLHIRGSKVVKGYVSHIRYSGFVGDTLFFCYPGVWFVKLSADTLHPGKNSAWAILSSLCLHHAVIGNIRLVHQGINTSLEPIM